MSSEPFPSVIFTRPLHDWCNLCVIPDRYRPINPFLQMKWTKLTVNSLQLRQWINFRFVFALIAVVHLSSSWGVGKNNRTSIITLDSFQIMLTWVKSSLEPIRKKAGNEVESDLVKKFSRGDRWKSQHSKVSSLLSSIVKHFTYCCCFCYFPQIG